ncbi:MAG: ABC transporter ATP-binding protein [Trueperaceae bacterium]
MSLLEVENLSSHLLTRRGTVKAVDGVSLRVEAGETLGLVGESGSGKSMTCLSIARLLPWPVGRAVGGKIIFDGKDLMEASEKEMSRMRGKELAMIPQDPFSSLNPVFSIGNQLMEPLRIHLGMSGKPLQERARELLSLVRIPEAGRRLNQYPHQLSGGMRQRVVGAMAASCRPKLVLADEPTTSLDVTTQAQFLYLLKSIQSEFGMGMIYVSHDLGVVARVSDRVAVMYAGKIVEQASAKDIFERPAHPYTRALLDSIAPVDRDVERLPSIDGDPPELYDIPVGCRFANRCPHVMPKCRELAPPPAKIGKDHVADCWLHYAD